MPRKPQLKLLLVVVADKDSSTVNCLQLPSMAASLSHTLCPAIAHDTLIRLRQPAINGSTEKAWQSQETAHQAHLTDTLLSSVTDKAVRFLRRHLNKLKLSFVSEATVSPLLLEHERLSDNPMLARMHRKRPDDERGIVHETFLSELSKRL